MRIVARSVLESIVSESAIKDDEMNKFMMEYFGFSFNQLLLGTGLCILLSCLVDFGVGMISLILSGIFFQVYNYLSHRKGKSK